MGVMVHELLSIIITTYRSRKHCSTQRASVSSLKYKGFQESLPPQIYRALVLCMKFIWTLLLKSSQEWMSTVPARHNGIVAHSSTSAWRRMSCISAHWPSGFSLDLITLSGAVKLQILQQPCVTAASNHRPEFSGDLTQIYLPTSPYVFRYSWSYIAYKFWNMICQLAL